VYRIYRDQDVLYLRVLPEIKASFAPEVLVHRLLRARHVHVPEVIYYEEYSATLQRSVMVTTEIRGHAIGYGANPSDIGPMVMQAGQELAIINRIQVEGFGWIRRDSSHVTQLEAEFPTCWAWIQQDVGRDITRLERSQLFLPEELQAFPEVIDRCHTLFAEEQAYLAHGDFDVTHIYQCDGVYTGIIDFGEIRGTQALYDVGHFAVESYELLPYLLEGYNQVAALPGDYMQRIRLSSFLIALRRLGRRLRKGDSVYPPDHQAVKRNLQALAAQ
jgi:hypothetical protein